MQKAPVEQINRGFLHGFNPSKLKPYKADAAEAGFSLVLFAQQKQPMRRAF
ncbi:hypothetical protein ACFQNF_15275 [Iodobacter arcticus]|uniref:Uncharacterized protein n=1 Tax=Iodobacter arcticus TaxID=590593 RepID=A0ABW2R0F8_9NEIS